MNTLPPIPDRKCDDDYGDCQRRALRARLKALAEYANHSPHSVCRKVLTDSNEPCDCGLSALLEQLTKEGLV